MCSRITCFVEIKLQYFSRKYIFIYTIYTLLMQLFSAILYYTCHVHGSSNLWEKSTASRTRLEQWSVTLLPIGKPRAADNMVSMFWGWYFTSSVCVCLPVIENDATKLYTKQQYIKRYNVLNAKIAVKLKHLSGLIFQGRWERVC